jgi:hypothetical protein
MKEDLKRIADDLKMFCVGLVFALLCWWLFGCAGSSFAVKQNELAKMANHKGHRAIVIPAYQKKN